MRYNLQRNRDEHGFTMVELLIVVGLIGILTAIAVPMWLNQRQQAWSTAVQSTVSNASTFIMDNHRSLSAQDAALNDGEFGYYSQSPSDPVEGGIPGFVSTENVELYVWGNSHLGKSAACIEGYHQMNEPTDATGEANDTGTSAENGPKWWHITVSNALNVSMPYKIDYKDGNKTVTDQQEALGALLPGRCIIGMDVADASGF